MTWPMPQRTPRDEGASAWCDETLLDDSANAQEPCPMGETLAAALVALVAAVIVAVW